MESILRRSYKHRYRLHIAAFFSTAAMVAPIAPSYKVNVDGVVFSQSCQAGVGVVIRDNEGEVIAALSKQIHQPLGPLEIEAKAMETGVSFAWDVGIREVIFECDSKIISDALLGLCTPPMIISNILARVSLKFQDFGLAQVSHVRRQGNRLAHILTKHAKDIVNSNNFVTWIEENPSLIESAIAHNVLNLSSS
ncbi:hypothetical protein SO802_012842 [Lithocarpus litseifolius]|uniref:RNase H type-1 domain-containing protein n=1 Tax=Lithocarpus litseifolius TaxID=425828 RepID=A0AAW2D7W9_9ROSI